MHAATALCVSCHTHRLCPPGGAASAYTAYRRGLLQHAQLLRPALLQERAREAVGHVAHIVERCMSAHHTHSQGCAGSLRSVTLTYRAGTWPRAARAQLPAHQVSLAQEAPRTWWVEAPTQIPRRRCRGLQGPPMRRVHATDRPARPPHALRAVPRGTGRRRLPAA